LPLQHGLVVTEPAEVHVTIDRALLQVDAWNGPFDRSAVGVALALLAAGRFEQVRARLLNDTSDSVLPLLLARYVAWSADLVTATALWERIHGVIDSLAAPPSQDDDDTVLRLASCNELQSVATDLGHRDDAAHLARAARSLRGSLADRPLAEDTRRAGTLLGVGTRPGFNTDPADGDVATASLVLLGFIHGVLAIEPDAMRGRIRLQPHVRASWSAMHVPQIRFADGLVSLRISRAADRTSVSIAQLAGAVPFTALLEPVIPDPVAAAEVDGKPATLDLARDAGASRAPVQLVLDDTRVLSLIHGHI
jgi:hypothetical protein